MANTLPQELHDRGFALQKVFEALPELYLLLSTELLILAASDAYLEATLAVRKDIIGKHLFEGFPDNPETPDANGVANLSASLRQVLTTGLPHKMSVQHYDVPRPETLGGGFEARYWLPLNTPVLGEKGEVLYIIHQVTNVTEQVTERQRGEQNEALSAELAAANSELLSVNQQLAHINSDLDNFIYTASHDLRAPIANIEGLLQLLTDNFLLKSMDAGETQHVLALMQGAVERFKRTISHLTEITKLQKENSPDASPVNLAAVLADVQLDLGPAIRATQAKLEIEVTACPTIHFSEKNLRSILYNLLSNAVKYHSPERALIVRVRCRETASHQVLSVRDNGLGMDLSQEHKLFAMFQRLHDHVEGSGIGLYMVKKIIENAGGWIEVQSKAGEGSEFSVYFRRNS